jgi:hypothetical protein
MHCLKTKIIFGLALLMCIFSYNLLLAQKEVAYTYPLLKDLKCILPKNWEIMCGIPEAEEPVPELEFRDPETNQKVDIYLMHNGYETCEHEEKDINMISQYWIKKKTKIEKIKYDHVELVFIQPEEFFNDDIREEVLGIIVKDEKESLLVKMIGRTKPIQKAKHDFQKMIESSLIQKLIENSLK